MSDNTTRENTTHDLLMARQGDVLLRYVTPPVAERLPLSSWRPIPTHEGRCVLAMGEARGHAHEVVVNDAQWPLDLPTAQFFEAPGGTRYLIVLRPSLLIHPEHGAISLPVGVAQVVRQREWRDGDWRSIAD